MRCGGDRRSAPPHPAGPGNEERDTDDPQRGFEKAHQHKSAVAGQKFLHRTDRTQAGPVRREPDDSSQNGRQDKDQMVQLVAPISLDR